MDGSPCSVTDGASSILMVFDRTFTTRSVLSENLAEIRQLQQQALQELEQAHQTFLQKGYRQMSIKLMGAANVFLHLNRLEEAYLFNALLENQPGTYGALQGLVSSIISKRVYGSHGLTRSCS